MNIRLESRRVRYALLALPAVGAALGWLLKDFAFETAKHLPRCPTFEGLGIYCPGCGLTRTLLAMLQLDIPLALRNNAVVVSLAVFLILLYVQFVCWSFGKRQVRTLPTRPWFWIAFGVCCAVYFVVRNFVPWMMPIKLY